MEINWKIAADRATVGERTELKTLPGFWVRPRRWTKHGEAEIKALELKPLIRRQAVRRKIVAEVQASGAAGASEADKMVGAVPEAAQGRIMEAMLENMDGETLDQLDAAVLCIVHGVAEHNFENAAGGPASKEWARELLGYRDVFDEVLEIVKEKNAPLARPTNPSSETLPNGSPTEPSSPTAPKSEA